MSKTFRHVPYFIEEYSEKFPHWRKFYERMARGQEGALYNYIGSPDSSKECGYDKYREVMNKGKKFCKKQTGRNRRLYNKKLTVLYSRED